VTHGGEFGTAGTPEDAVKVKRSHNGQLLEALPELEPGRREREAAE
jgi:hypothetical protein